MSQKFDEHPEAGEEWIAKAMLIGAAFYIDHSVWGIMWSAEIENPRARCFGATKARAARKLVRYITGVE